MSKERFDKEVGFKFKSEHKGMISDYADLRLANEYNKAYNKWLEKENKEKDNQLIDMEISYDSLSNLYYQRCEEVEQLVEDKKELIEFLNLPQNRHPEEGNDVQKGWELAFNFIIKYIKDKGK
jgi:hypothetical protein